MKKKIITLILGTLILFMWNAISWMALPFHSSSLKNIPESTFESQNLKNKLQEDGIYHYPGLPESNSSEDIKKIKSKLKKGSRITFMAYKTGSTELFEIKTFVINLIFNFLTVCLILFVMQNQRNKSLKKIVLTTLSIGLIIGFASDFPQMNWFMFPLDYTLPNVFDHLISFGLLGLLLGMYTFKTKEI